MRFHWTDHGTSITGYVVPDNPTAISRITISVHGRQRLALEATKVDEHLRQLGLHATGQCTFEITDAQLPDLAELERLEIYDADTNVLVHRRAPRAVEAKVMLFNTSIEPESTIETALFPHFRQSYFGIARFPEEILRALLDTRSVTSCLLSGAAMFPRYEGHIVNAEASSMIMVHDPFAEMARRLIWLRERTGLASDAAQAWRLGPLAEAALFAAEYDYADAKSLKRFFRMLPEAAYRMLYNPLTRQLGTRGPEDEFKPGNSVIAAEILSHIDVVGHRDYFEAFVASAFNHIGVEADIPAPPAIPAETLALAERLRPLRFAQDMINFDAIISDAVRSSVAKSWHDWS